MKADEILERFPRARVIVLGDSMLDVYLDARAERVCREAPVPVVRLSGRRVAPGGAANMAMNLASMGSSVRFISLVGADAEGDELVEALEAGGVDCSGIVRAVERETVTKRRLVADGQLLVRFDSGTESAPGDATFDALVEALVGAVSAGGSLVVSDYGAGVLTERMIAVLAVLRDDVRGPLVVDSTRLTAFRPLRPDVVKPSLAEALTQLAIEPAPPSSRMDLAEALCDAMLDLSGARRVALTLDEDGAIVCESGSAPVRLPARHHGAAHPAGAGDTFLAAFTLALTSGADGIVASELAMAAAGVVVAEEGTSLCTIDTLRAAAGCDSLMRIVDSSQQLAAIAASHRQAGRRIVFTNGCFDILHPGHIALLEQARSLGDVLVIAVNSDEGVRALKGEGRPVNRLEDRLKVLSALSFVDHLVAFSEPTADALIELVCPDVYVKGGDYAPDEIPEAQLVTKLGGQVEILPYFGGESTTEIIERIRKSGLEQVS